MILPNVRFLVVIGCVASSIPVSLSATEEPAYQTDPFSDADFVDAPLILGMRHPNHGRLEVGFLASASVVDKYVNHRGGIVDVSYNLLDTVGLQAAFGYMVGRYTSIVTDGEGIIGNRVQRCMDDVNTCDEVNPKLPDFKQITGMVELLAVWSPLYGKINLVSEWNANLQWYGLLGGGMHGTRTTHVRLAGPPQTSTDYKIDNQGVLDGGLFSGLKGHGTVGAGLRLHLLEWLALRTEFRTLLFLDRFEFTPGKGKETYLSAHYFAHIGFGFTL